MTTTTLCFACGGPISECDCGGEGSEQMPDDLFFVWVDDDIDSSFYEDTDEPRDLYVCLLCRDTDGRPDVVRGFDPRDGIFERPGLVVESLGGIDVLPPNDYARQVERELIAQFESRRESMIERGRN